MFKWIDNWLCKPTPNCKQCFWGYIGITLSVHLTVYLSSKHNSSLTDERILMKLYTVALYNLSMTLSIKKYNLSPKNIQKNVDVWLLSVLRGHSVFSSPPQRPMTSDFEGFSIQDFIHYIYFPILIPEKEPVFSLFNVQC